MCSGAQREDGRAKECAERSSHRASASKPGCVGRASGTTAYLGFHCQTRPKRRGRPHALRPTIAWRCLWILSVAQSHLRTNRCSLPTPRWSAADATGALPCRRATDTFRTDRTRPPARARDTEESRPYAIPYNAYACRPGDDDVMRKRAQQGAKLAEKAPTSFHVFLEQHAGLDLRGVRHETA